MDNANMPIIAVNTKTGQWEKVLDSQLPQAISRLGEEAETFRVNKEARVILKKNGQLVIKGISFPLCRK